MSDFDRRQFLKTAVFTFVASGMVPLIHAADPPAEDGLVDVGELKSFDHDGIYDAFAGSHKILLVRGDDQLIALTTRCTHKGKTVQVRDGQIVCPAHGARYSAVGKVTKGPAKRPLPHLGIHLDDKGHVIVNKNTAFPDDRWADAGSFVSLKSGDTKQVNQPNPG